MAKRQLAKPKCTFVKMGTKKHQLLGKTKDVEKRKKILEDRDKRIKEWRKWYG
tara:strand:- start:65 stop:223 length:159 start_codon:yes stop_codon:yes gene_type:complete